MALIRWEPFKPMTPYRGFEAFRRHMDRLFDDYNYVSDAEIARSGWVPAVDLSEDGDKFTLRAEMPGLDKKDIKLSLEDRVLTLSGEKKLDREKKERSFYLVERCDGRFSRSFTLPAKVDGEKIKAEFKHGILEIELPKAAEAKSREIEIQLK